MITLIIVILLCSAISNITAGEDWEASEFNAEQRHDELLNVINTADKPKVVHREDRTIQRRAIKDSAGNTLIEEVIVESLEDLI